MKHIRSVLFCVCTVSIIGLFSFSCDSKKKSSPAVEEVAEEVALPDTLKLLFVGDVMVHSTQYNAARYEGGDSTYNFYPTFQFIEDYIQSADVAMANLEVPFGGEPYSGYPVFSSPPQIADALKMIGFTALFTANNHTADKGRKGLLGTLDYLDKIQLQHTGAFRDSAEWAERYPLLLEVNNIRLSILNYTYGTNGMPVYKPNRVNLIDTLQIKEDLAKAQQQQPDYIITCMHWGNEYQNKEDKGQRELARFLAEQGTNLIVAAHPHVVQSYEEIITLAGDTVPVIYSMGNFVSNQQWRYADGGIVFETTLIKTGDKTIRHSSAYEPFWVNRFNDHVRSIYRLIPVNDYLRDSVKYNLNAEQKGKMIQFYDDTKLKLPDLEYSGFFD